MTWFWSQSRGRAIIARTMCAVCCAAASWNSARGQESVPDPAAGPALGRAAQAAVPVEPPVLDVQVQGNRAVPLAKISPLIRTRAGRTFDPELVEKDVRQLIGSKLFLDVKTKIRQTPQGVIVLFQVFERPTLEYVKYYGHKRMKRKALEKQTELKPGDALDPYAVEEGRRRIEEYYHQWGYTHVQVRIDEGTKPGDRGAVYTIHEGPRQRVKQVNFVGNSNSIATAARLRTQIESKRPFLWFWKGFVDPEKVDGDVERLTAYYRSLGFFQAQVGREQAYNADQSRLTLTFFINEGIRYKVRNVSFIGNSKFDQPALASDLKLEAGEFFDQLSMNADVNTIQEVYGGDGYIYANIKPDPRFLETPGELDLVYVIEEGARYRIRQVNIHIDGENPHTRHTTILNRLSLYPGEIADIRELRASVRRLKASGLFLNNPAQGEEPKIVFSLPDADDEEEALAERPRRTTGFRGQSPDRSRESAGLSPRRVAGGDGPNEQWIDVDVSLPPLAPSEQSELEPKPAPIENRPPAPASASPRPIVRGQSPDTDANAWRPAGAMKRRPIAAPPSAKPATASLSPRRVAGGGTAGVSSSGTQHRTVRGQYTPFGGRPLPTYGRSAPAQTTVPGPVAQPQATAPPVGSFYSQPQTLGPQSGNPTEPRQITPPATVGTPQPQTVPAPSVQPISPTAPLNAAPPYAPPSGSPMPQGASPAPSVGGYASPEELFPEGGVLSPFDQEPTEWVDVDPYVQETQTGRLMFGVGVNSDAGVVGSIVLDEQNFDWQRFPRSWDDIRTATAFRGAGQQLRIEAVPGTEVQRYLFSFREPYLFDSQVSFGLSGYFFDRRYTDWDEQRLGGRVSLGYQLTPDLSGTLSLRAENVNVHDPAVPTPPEILEVLGDNDLFVARLALVHDTRDNAFLATEGHYIEVGYDQGFGEFDYPRGTAEARQFFMIRERPDHSGRHVLAVGGEIGVTGNNTPVFEHFFAGGFSTLRGFDFRGASPRSPSGAGAVVGGDFLLLASIEYLFPITADDMLRGVVFCDAGTVEESVKLEADDFRVSPGFGLRISIPALGPAPIALDLAFPVAHAVGDDIQNFSFFIGFGRN